LLSNANLIGEYWQSLAAFAAQIIQNTMGARNGTLLPVF